MPAPAAEHFGIVPDYFNYRRIEAAETFAEALAHVRNIPLGAEPVARKDYALHDAFRHPPEALRALEPLVDGLVDEHSFNAVEAIHYKPWHDGRPVDIDLLPPQKKHQYKGALVMLWLDTPAPFNSLRATVQCRRGNAIMQRVDALYRIGLPASPSASLVVFGFDTNLAS